MRQARRHSQGGAALGIALLILVVIILLGVAAVRSTQVELKLAQNAESRMAAIQSAESMVTVGTPYLVVDENASFMACASAVPDKFACPATGANPIDLAVIPALLQQHGYAQVRRLAPLFVEVNVLREAELSAKNYDFARYNIIGGFDRSDDGLSAAEVTEGVLKLHPKIAGVSYEP